MNEPTINIVGRVGSDPELKFTPAGRAVCNVSVAQTARVKRNETWEDGETIWFRVSVWGAMAEATFEQVAKGALVSVYGRLTQRTYETKTGEKRIDLVVDAESVALVPITKQQPKQEDVAPW